MLNKCRRQMYSKETNLHSKEKNNYFLLYKQRVNLKFYMFQKKFLEILSTITGVV